jgi:hypothetical protein
MFLPPSLMTEKDIRISEQRLLSSCWTNVFFFNESEVKDLLQTPDKAHIPVIRMKKRW